jgi:hypothetical protein
MSVNNNLAKNSPNTEPLEQVVYACLTNIFNAEEANLALKSWAHHSSGASSAFNGINSFAREICNNLNQPEKHRELAKALNRALIIQLSPSTANKPSAPELVEANNDNLQKEKSISKHIGSSTSTEPALANSSFLTFQFIILEVMKYLTRQGETTKAEAVEFLNEITETMPWSEIQQQQILALINDGKLQPLRTYKLDQLKNFIKYFKTWISDKLGNDAANLIVTQVTEHVATMKETKDVSPKIFFTA